MIRGQIARARQDLKVIRDARFRQLHMTTKENDVRFARYTDFCPFSRLAFYDRSAYGAFAQVAEEFPKKMRVEECAR